MKVLIAYYSQTGNTKKVADAIFKAVDAEKEFKSLSEVADLSGYDMAFIGFPIISFGMAPEVKSFIEKQASGENIALFATHSAPEDNPIVQPWLDSCKQAAAGANLVGFFNCQGELGEKVAAYMLNSGNQDLVNWAKMRPATVGQPDAPRLEKAGAWAKGIIAGYQAGKS